MPERLILEGFDRLAGNLEAVTKPFSQSRNSGARDDNRGREAPAEHRPLPRGEGWEGGVRTSPTCIDQVHPLLTSFRACEESGDTVTLRPDASCLGMTS